MIKKSLKKLVKKYPAMRRLKARYVRVRNRQLRQYYNRQRINNNLIVFESYMSHNYACSPRAIYEYMLKDSTYKNYQFIWSFREPSKYKHLINERTRLVKFGSLQYYKAYAKAKFWVVNGWIPLNVYKRPGQIMLQTWHGAMFKRLRNDIIPSNKHATTGYDESVRLGMLDVKRYDFFISTAHFFSKKIISAFGLKDVDKESIIIETGYPRNDFLINHSSHDVNNMRSKLDLPKDKKVILYTPTWRDDQHNGKRFTYKTQVDFGYLKKKLSDRYVILFRAHYNVVKDYNLSEYNGFVYDVSDLDDVNDLYIISDLLITDYSSTFFDFMALKRPILFFMYDYEHYAKTLHGLYLEIDELPGKVVTTEKQIVEQLKNTDTYQESVQKKYEMFHRKYTYLNDGRATERVIERVFSK